MIRTIVLVLLILRLNGVYCSTPSSRSLYFACETGVLSQDKNSFRKIAVHYFGATSAFRSLAGAGVALQLISALLTSAYRKFAILDYFRSQTLHSAQKSFRIFPLRRVFSHARFTYGKIRKKNHSFV